MVMTEIVKVIQMEYSIFSMDMNDYLGQVLLLPKVISMNIVNKA